MHSQITPKMVATAEDYGWSSYRSKTGLENSAIVDLDPCYPSFKQPHCVVSSICRGGCSEVEQRFIMERLSRNQLTGEGAFVNEIELRTDIRIKARSPERPEK